MRRHPRFIWVVLAVGCGQSSGDIDGGRRLDGAAVDASPRDARPFDAHAETDPDGAPSNDDAFVPVDPCAGRMPPEGMTRDTAFLLFSMAPSLTHTDVFSSPFPGGTDDDIEVEEGMYAALRFETGTTPLGVTGRFAFNAIFSTEVRNGRKIVTISECAGDFTEQVDPLCRREVFVGSIEWTMGPGNEPSCNLEQNKTYYINILYTEDDGPDYRWSCSAWPDGDGRCGNTFNPRASR